MFFNLGENEENTFADIKDFSEPLFSPGKVIVSKKIYCISQDDEEFTDKMVICLFRHSCNDSELTEEKDKYNNGVNIKDNKGAVINKYTIDNRDFIFITYLHPTFKEPCIEKLFGDREDTGDVITTHVMLKEEY